MIYFYYFGFVFLGYLFFLLFKKTGKPLDITLSTDVVDMGRQANDLAEENEKQPLFWKIKMPVLVVWIGIGIFFSDYHFTFLSLFILGAMHAWNKINKDDSSRRIIFAILDVSRIALISIVLFDYFYTKNL